MKKRKQTNEVRRLTNLEMSDFVAENEIKDHTQLLAVAEMQKKEGKRIWQISCCHVHARP